MGNICQNIFGTPVSGSQPATERSGLLENQHSSMRQPVSRTSDGPFVQRQTSAAAQQDSPAVPYTARSVANTRTKSFDGNDITFDRIGLENLDKRLSDISTLFNSLLERYSNLKTGLLQLEQLAKEVCSKSQARTNQSSTTGDVIVKAFECFARQAAQSADSGNRVSVKVKENAKNWIEAVFDSKSLQYEEISFLNLYNLLSRYAWELRSKVPPLRNTIAMTILEEETFRRDLLVASLNSETNAFAANFSRLRRLDERLGEFEKIGADAGEKLTEAGKKLLD